MAEAHVVLACRHLAGCRWTKLKSPGPKIPDHTNSLPKRVQVFGEQIVMFEGAAFFNEVKFERSVSFMVGLFGDSVTFRNTTIQDVFSLERCWFRKDLLIEGLKLPEPNSVSFHDVDAEGICFLDTVFEKKGSQWPHGCSWETVRVRSGGMLIGNIHSEEEITTEQIICR